MDAPDLPKVALIAGPTASGKSALALALARKHRGTVINADSMQVYADLRILTARPTVDEETSAPHRLFGHVDGAAPYSAVIWAAEARAAIAEAHGEGRLPILVGGTGLYIRTLIHGIAPVPEIDADIRAEVRGLPVAVSHARLQQHDPAAAARLNAADTTRVARALEVVLSTGKPLADWQKDRGGGIGDDVDFATIILLPDRDWLGERIDRRFAMMADSAAEEVTALLGRGDVAPQATVMRAIGVRELGAVQRGEIDLAQANAEGALATRQYAKRQYTWFRREPVPAHRTQETQTDALVDIFETKLLI